MHFLTSSNALDLILVLKDGVVAEQGTHEELLRHGGLYSSMWIQQSSDTSNVDSDLGLTAEVLEDTSRSG
jgi:ABC-type transport system involved in cytochrome bd biosynthesis fused ATPase/permease subunit